MAVHTDEYGDEIEITAVNGRSYGCVHDLLAEADVEFRKRGGTTRTAVAR